MKKHWMLLVSLVLCLLLFTTGAMAAQYYAQTTPLTMRLSTRTGPSTAYTEPGTFFRDSWQTTSVKVISKAYGNDVWWVQVEFMNNGKLMRAYTGAKRVALDVSNVREETTYGTATVKSSIDVTGYYGPGTHYAQYKEAVPRYVSGSVIDSQDGYILFDFYDANCDQQRRAWVSEDRLNIEWFGGPSTDAVLEHNAMIYPGDLFFEEDGESVWCRLLSYGHNKSYTMIDLYIHGLTYTNLPVYMEGADHGTFVTSDGTSGFLWFYTDRVIMDYYAQALSGGALCQLMKSE